MTVASSPTRTPSSAECATWPRVASRASLLAARLEARTWAILASLLQNRPAQWSRPVRLAERRSGADRLGRGQEPRTRPASGLELAASYARRYARRRMSSGSQFRRAAKAKKPLHPSRFEQLEDWLSDPGSSRTVPFDNRRVSRGPHCLTGVRPARKMAAPYYRRRPDRSGPQHA